MDFSKLIRIGVREQANEDENRRIILMNVLCYLVVAICLGFGLIYVAVGSVDMVPSNLISALLFTGILLFNHLGLAQLGRYTAIIGGNVSLFIGYQMAQGALEIDRFYQCLAVVPIMLFPFNRKWSMVICGAISTVFAIVTPYVPIFITGFTPIKPDQAWLFNVFIPPITILVTMLPPLLLYLMSEKYFNEMVNAQQNEVEQSRMAALGQMAAGMAHEINNPLAIISGRSEQLEMIVESGQTNPDHLKASAETIRKNSNRIMRIVSGLRTYARDGKGDALVLVPVREIIDGVMELCHEKVVTHEISLEVKVDEGLSIQCSESQIMQVLVNLMNNAVDALGESDIRDKKIVVSAEDVSPNIVVSVQDNGKGIAEELLSRITEPFFTTKSVGKGTGLGLSISKGIMEHHHGSLKVSSKPGQTVFSLYFPRPEVNEGLAG